jgi:hypothetical protein
MPDSFSHFVADKEGDSWYMCYISFNKFMVCNERSPVKLDEINMYNQSFWNYACYEQFAKLWDNCGQDLFEPLWEMYKVRLLNAKEKSPSYSRILTFLDPLNGVSDRKNLYY